ncbi:hypothetical protein AAVH_09931 [Aphelenchoides avenae]|nr:hypothetical protein AAVH_09931 [Aphelenchus avenae]
MMKKKKTQFWCSLFALLVSILCIGVSRGVLDRQLTIRRPTDGGAYTTTVGELGQDYVLSDPTLKRAFVPGATVHYHTDRKERRPSRRGKKPPGTGDVADELSRLWRSIVDGATLDFFDGRTDSANYEWMKFVVVYVVDYIRYDLALERIRKTHPKTATASLSEPVQWAAWRMFAINVRALINVEHQ